jgi:hypothetical protein
MHAGQGIPSYSFSGASSSSSSQPLQGGDLARPADPDSKLTVEELDRLDRCIAEMHQAGNNRFDFARPELLERYLVAEICFHLQFLVHFSETDCQDFGTVWFGPQKLIGPLLGRKLSDESIGHPSAEIDLAGYVCGADNDRQQSMLVGIVELLNDPQRIVRDGISPICVSIGLKAFDDRQSASGDSIYFPPLSGRYKFLLSEANRKRDIGIGCSMVLKSERPDQMIQTRPQMVDNLSSQNRKSQGNDFGIGNEGALLRLMINVSSYRIGIRLDKGGNFGFEILDILVGPLNLRPTPVEWM